VILYKLAWRNVWRQKRRTLITLLTMALCVAVAIPTFGLAEGITREMVNGVTQSHLGHIQIHNPHFPRQEDPSYTLDYDALLMALEQEPQIRAAAARIYTGGMLSARHSVLFTLRQLTGPGHAPCEVVVQGRPDRLRGISAGTALYPSPPVEDSCIAFTVAKVVRAPREAILVEPSLLPRFVLSLPQCGDDDDIDGLERIPTERGGKQKPQAKRQDDTALRAKPEASWRFDRILQTPITVMMIDPPYERRVTAVALKLSTGHYLDADPTRGSSQILLGRRTARRLDVTAGATVGLDLFSRAGMVLDATYTVAGVFELGVPELEDTLIYIHISHGWSPEFTGKTGQGRRVNEVALRVDDPGQASAVAHRLRARLGANLLVRSWKEIKPSMARVIGLQEGLVAMILLIIIAVAVIGTINTMMMSVLERTQEFGVLKAIGLGPVKISALILMESVVITSLALLLGVAMGAPLCLFLGTHGIDLSMFLSEGFTLQGVLLDPVWRPVLTAQSLWIPCGLLAAATLTGALLPAVRAAGLSAVKELRDG